MSCAASALICRVIDHCHSLSFGKQGHAAGDCGISLNYYTKRLKKNREVAILVECWAEQSRCDSHWDNAVSRCHSDQVLCVNLISEGNKSIHTLIVFSLKLWTVKWRIQGKKTQKHFVPLFSFYRRNYVDLNSVQFWSITGECVDMGGRGVSRVFQFTVKGALQEQFVNPTYCFF